MEKFNVKQRIPEIVDGEQYEIEEQKCTAFIFDASDIYDDVDSEKWVAFIPDHLFEIKNVMGWGGGQFHTYELQPDGTLTRMCRMITYNSQLDQKIELNVKPL